MKISIIVPIFNIEKYLEKCLKNLILTNSFVNEIICVNDGSTDSSVEIIRNYQQKDSRIILLDQNNHGLCSARNAGIEKATGDYIVFVDGDDYICIEDFNQALEELYNIIQTINIDAAWYGYIRNDWDGERVVEPIFEKRSYDQMEIKTMILPSIIGISLPKLYKWFSGEGLQTSQEFPSVWRFVYSKTVIDQYHIRFNEHMMTGEDILFNWEFLVYSNCVFISDYKYYHYIWRRGSLTQNSMLHFFQSKKILVEEREKLNLKLKNIVGDYSHEYQGTLILTPIQMALVLSKCQLKQVCDNYRLFKGYTEMLPITAAYQQLELEKAPLKFKIPLYMVRKKWNMLMFFCCYILNKFKIYLYPD